MSYFCYLHIFPNEKIYVGTTQLKKPERRWGFEGRCYKRQPLVWRVIQKYGWENVKHKVIECETSEEMWEKEKELIKEYDTTNPEKGYNLSTGGEKSTFGYKYTEEQRRKISEGCKGKSKKKGRVMPESVKIKISKTKRGKTPWNKDKNTPEEVKRKISETKKNSPKPKWLTPQGEIREMYASCVSHWHKDWILIQNQ